MTVQAPFVASYLEIRDSNVTFFKDVSVASERLIVTSSELIVNINSGTLGSVYTLFTFIYLQGYINNQLVYALTDKAIPCSEYSLERSDSSLYVYLGSAATCIEPITTDILSSEIVRLVTSLIILGIIITTVLVALIYVVIKRREMREKDDEESSSLSYMD